MLIRPMDRAPACDDALFADRLLYYREWPIIYE